MSIAILGWGSLIRCPGELQHDGMWETDGPRLPIEFARQSGMDSLTETPKLTLVILREAPVDPAYEGTEWYPQTLWTRSRANDLQAAKEALRARERTTNANIGVIERGGDGGQYGERGAIIAAWLESKPELSAVIWTDLDAKPTAYSMKAGEHFLRMQLHNTRAIDYINDAPRQTMTPLRLHLEKELATYFYDNTNG